MQHLVTKVGGTTVMIIQSYKLEVDAKLETA